MFLQKFLTYYIFRKVTILSIKDTIWLYKVIVYSYLILNKTNSKQPIYYFYKCDQYVWKWDQHVQYITKIGHIIFTKYK